MTSFNAKLNLYKFVDKLRSHLAINYESYPINTIEICENDADTYLEYRDFNCEGFCGAAIIGDKSDTIILNRKRNEEELNFDCGHEIIHVSKHRNGNDKFFHCFEKITQNQYLEWEANEGSAELVVPYKLFIPKYVELSLSHKGMLFGHERAVEDLAKSFFVSESVIDVRLDSLQYEIYQYYIDGKSIDDITLLSKNQREKMGYASLRAEKHFCCVCFSRLGVNQNICHICGKRRSGLNFRSKQWGLGFMEYKKEFDLDKTGKMQRCVKCDNSEILDNALFCHICGTCVRNVCAGTPKIEGAFSSTPCNKPAIGNARYCVYCGSETTFFKSGLLSSKISEMSHVSTNKNYEDELP